MTAADPDSAHPRRIDPASVAAWFAGHPDVEPVRGRFVEFGVGDDGTLMCPWACCGLSGLIADLPDGIVLLRDLYRWSAEPIALSGGKYRYPSDLFATTLGLGVDYVRGFICGWDGQAPLADHDSPEAYAAGRVDGLAAYEMTTAALAAFTAGREGGTP